MGGLSDEQNVLILVMGATGAGKTTFINKASGSALLVGDTLDSCTATVQLSKPFVLDGRVVTLVDSPGFDDTDRSETEILQEVASFLKQTYKQNCLLSGILYMHDITSTRVGGVARRNLGLFYSLCGEQSLKNVIVVTNMWTPNADEAIAKREAEREKELASNAKLFKTAVEGGARILRHNDSAHSAYTIIRHVLQNQRQALDLQHELIDEKKILAETGVGKRMRGDIDTAMDVHRKELTELQRQYHEEVAKLQEMQARRRDFLTEKDITISELKLELEKKSQDIQQIKQDIESISGKRGKLFERMDSFDKRMKQLMRRAYEEIKALTGKHQKRRRV